MTTEAVAFTSYRPLLVRLRQEQPLPSLGSAIAAKSQALGLPRSRLGDTASAQLFDVDAAAAKRSAGNCGAVDWCQIDLLARIQPKAADFLRSVDFSRPGEGGDGTKK